MISSVAPPSVARFQSPLLQHVPHAFFGRVGGTSIAPHQSLNASLHVGDRPGAVSENRERIRLALSLAASPVFVRQVHGSVLLRAQDAVADKSEADGLFCENEIHAIGVLTADCVPILAASKDGLLVVCLHAGWRGIAARFPEAALQAACRKTGRVASDFMVAVGPAIGPCCYVVRDQAQSELRRAYADEPSAFASAPSGASYVDLWQLARVSVRAAGVPERQIDEVRLCTRCDSRFYSYRRDQTTGRQAAVIQPRLIS